MCQAVPGCDRMTETKAGYCIMHYKRWKRNGIPDCVLRKYENDAKCEFCGKAEKLRKGLCKACSIRKMRKGYVERDQAKAGEGTITAAGYRLMTKFGEREYEHRLVVNAKLGQVVHHKDENKLNNDPSNLLVFNSQSEHMKEHHKKED